MLDKIIGSLLSNALGATKGGQDASAVTDVLGALLKSQGGMEGIFNQLQQGGLGNLLESWIGTGSNQPIESGQLSEVFGEDTISGVARQAGVDNVQAQDILSQTLPNLVDILTPNGREGGVSTDNLARATRQAQQEGGFGLDELIGGLGGLLGGGQPTGGNSADDLLGRIFNTPTQTSQTAEPSSNTELAKDIGAVLNGFFK